MSSSHPNTKTRILESCLALLQAGEGNKVRMSDIAKAAGVSRQAVYLHFPNRADLLMATTHYLDRVKHIDDRLQASRSAKDGGERLMAFIDAWGNYIPEVYGVAKALMAMEETDEEARRAWGDRKQAVRQGCAAAVAALDSEGRLLPDLSVDTATDLLTALLSVRNWEQLTQECGWSQTHYIESMKSLASRALIACG